VFRSTVFRFAALVFVLQLAAAAALLFGTAALVRGQVTAEADRAAAALMAELRAVRAAGGADALAREVAARAGGGPPPRAVLLLVDRNGTRVAGNLDAWPPSVVAGGGTRNALLYRTGHAAPEAMRVGAAALPDGGRLLAGAVTEGEARALRRLEEATGLALTLALAFAAVAAWASARLIVARLEGTLAALDGVAAGDLGRRVAPDAARDSFADLGRAVNGALDRVDTLVTELRVATDALAHDLKSPLTRMRAALERAASKAGSVEALDRALVEADRLMAVVQTALGISRAEAGIGRENFAEADLGLHMADMAEIYAPLAEETGRTVLFEAAEGPVVARVHRELLAQAIGNLIDNALKYGGGPITLSLAGRVDGVRLSVADRGPGIPADRRHQALRRFGRLDEARGGDGAGLGLALAAAVARLHGGALVLGDAAPGLLVTMDLPR